MDKKDKPYAIITKCTGEAHSNPFIDHCSICMPGWGDIPTCSKCGGRLIVTDRGNYRCRTCKVTIR